MSSTNRSTTSYVLESTIGVTPANPAFKALRNTSNALEYKPTRVTSNELRGDRQVTDQILTDLMSSGPVGVELSFAALDDMIEAGFQGAWANKPAVLSGISALTTTTATIASGGAAFKAQMLVLTSNFLTPANNGLFVVSSNTGTSIVFPASSFTAEATPPAAASVRVVGFQGASGDITATATGLASTVLDFTTLGLNVGEWVKVGGDSAASQFATAANNSYARISNVAAGALTFGVLPASWAADTGTSKTIQVFTGDFLTNGTTERGFTIERQQQDLAAPSYELFKGCEVNTLSLTLKSASIITGSIGYTGTTATASTVRAAGATDIAAPTYPVMNAAGNVGRLAEGGNVVSGPSYITDLSFDLNNNLARRTAVGVLGAVGNRNGELTLSGTLNAYFGDLNLLNKVLNDISTSLMFRAGSTAGNRESLLIDVPQAKLEGTAPISGKNQDRSFSGKYDAYRHPTLGYTCSAGRFWYLPLAS